MEHIPRLSDAVYVGMCREVGTPDEVRIRRDVEDTGEVVKRPVNKMNGLHKMISGSHREGFRLKTSDIDFMHWLPHHEVICDLSQISLYRVPQHTVILMEWEDLPPGFTRLQLMSDSHNDVVKSSCVIRNNEHYISSMLFKTAFSQLCIDSNPAYQSSVPHGPCLSFSQGQQECDCAFCFASQHWPTLATPWVERCRQKGWPSDDVLHDIIQSGFHVVPIGSDNDREDEWRISFSQAEQKLVYAMNHSQFLCYGLLKIFLKEVINSGIKDPILCSYFMKTILFWVIQEDASLTWTPDNLLPNFWRCFKLLIYWISIAECPNFFIPQNNMFRVKVKGAAQNALFNRLYDLYCKGIPCLLLSPTLRSYLSQVILDRTLTVRTDEDSIIPSHRLDMQVFKETYHLVASIRNMKYFANYMMTIENIMAKRQSPCHVVCIQKMTSVVLLRTAWYIINYTETHNKDIALVSNKVCHMLKIASQIGYVSDILYLAMYYYRTCRYEQSLRCLQRAQERMSVPYVMYRDNVNVEMYRRAMTGVSLSDKMRKAVVSDIKLKSDYTYIDELLLEQTVSYRNGRSALYIPPLVMLHMLSVLNHHRLHHTLESHQALQNLQTLLLNDVGVHVPEQLRDISYQILGICQHVCGDYVGALNSYQYSHEQYQHHKIQQASIYRIHSLIQT
ncbi:uncharacterized protein LOC125662682 [Ostrea edulis]|uniref:uncharacterized protein LOC125662682 n=1 Tax=Ostrea edulis TaxID=37623 RepID=UPI0024AF10B1|nr:uncharacterized protein LOC125662682 [Ostrea edulis]